jgi:hypothetical protein
VEHGRPCAHVVATLLAADGFDLWNVGWFKPRWHSDTWRRQNMRVVPRVQMRAYDWYQTELVPAQLTLAPGRKKTRPYVPQDKPRKCFACGGFGHFAQKCKNPDIDAIVIAKKKETMRAVASIIDLSNCED